VIAYIAQPQTARKRKNTGTRRAQGILNITRQQEKLQPLTLVTLPKI